jgi:hypothetical protein
MNDPIWFKNLEILFTPSRLIEFVIIDDMNFNEKLNAILRFSIYSALLLFAFKRNAKVLLFPIFVAGLTMYLAKYQPKDDKDIENMDIVKCTMPTKKNPYMNTLISDYDTPDRPRACNINDPAVQAEVDKFMNHNQYRNANDLYNQNDFGRQFYTNPVTTITQDEYDTFVNWVYKNPNETCKENSNSCKVYDDIRYKRTTVQ